MAPIRQTLQMSLPCKSIHAHSLCIRSSNIQFISKALHDHQGHFKGLYMNKQQQIILSLDSLKIVIIQYSQCLNEVEILIAKA